MRSLRRAVEQYTGPWLSRLTIRSALFFGFWTIFAIWAISGYTLVRRLHELETRTSQVNANFTRKEHLLFVIRNQVQLGAVYLRDAVLDTGSDQADHVRRLERTRQETDEALAEYGALADTPADRQHWNQLRGEIEAYWQTALPVLEWDQPRRAVEAREFLRRNVIPRRNDIIRISERIFALNRNDYAQQQHEVEHLFQEARGRVWWSAALAILVGVGIAVFVTRYVIGLERKILEQHWQDVSNKRDLQRLSTRLVTAQEEERRAISRELHDEIGQALTAIKMDLGTVERATGAGLPDKATAAVADVRSIADRTLQSIRDLSQFLRPPMLDDLGLTAALKWYIRGFSGRTGISTELVSTGGDLRMDPEVELCAYRIVQEALTNVARHAGATTCAVRLQRDGDLLRVRIEDNGSGFDAAAVQAAGRPAGLGLLGIRERVAALGGAFALESRPGGGTCLAAELPAPAVDPSDLSLPAPVPAGGSAQNDA